MPKSTTSQESGELRPKKFPVVPVLVAAAILGVVVTIRGFTFAATQEQRDPFCASCHTQPEATFYSRSITAPPVDLASAHTTYKTHCIDCHSGGGVPGRVAAELLGARNAMLYFTHTAVQPAKLTFPIGDSSCLKCHQAVTTAQGQPNHYHALLGRWQAADAKAGGCVSCHSGHGTAGSADTRYLVDPVTQTVCAACHRVLRGGG